MTPGRGTDRQGRGTDRQTFRLSAQEWAAFEHAAAAMGLSRAEYLRQFVRWAIRAAGARRPGRPAPAADHRPVR